MITANHRTGANTYNATTFEEWCSLVKALDLRNVRAYGTMVQASDDNVRTLAYYAPWFGPRASRLAPPTMEALS